MAEDDLAAVMPLRLWQKGVSTAPKRASWRCYFGFAARCDPARIKAAVPTRETIAYARVYHDLTKFDLALMGCDLTRPFIAATGGGEDRVRLLDCVSYSGKRMPHHALR
jgi:hypothetical protein